MQIVPHVCVHAVQIQKSRRADLREDLAQLQRAHSATTGRTAELTSRVLELSGSLRTQVPLFVGYWEQLLAACIFSLLHRHILLAAFVRRCHLPHNGSLQQAGATLSRS